MQVPSIIFGLLFCAVGAVWILQGIGVIQGSFMTDQRIWSVAGFISFVVGVRFILRGARRHA